MRSHPHGVLRYRPGSSTWKRDSSTIQMGSTNNLTRIKGKNLGSMDLDTNVVKGGSAMAFGQEKGGNYDPWPLRSPSQAVSTGTVSARQEAFSPAAIDRLHHMDFDVGQDMCGSEAQRTMENLNDFNNSCQGDKAAFRNDQLGEDMEFDSEAEKNMTDLFLGQRRMALTRLGRHESHSLELSRYGSGPRQ